VEVLASLSQGRTAATQCSLFTHKSVLVIFEPPCSIICYVIHKVIKCILNKEELCEQWKDLIILPFYKKHYKMECSNF